MAINDLKASGQRWALSESIWNIQDSRFHLWVFQKNTATSSQVAKIFKQKPRATSWFTMQCWPKGLNFILVHSREHLFLLCEMQYKQFDYFSLIASSIFIVLQFQSGIKFLSCWNCSWLNNFFSMRPITWRIQPKLEIILKILHVLNLPFIAHVHSLTKQSNQIQLVCYVHSSLFTLVCLCVYSISKRFSHTSMVCRVVCLKAFFEDQSTLLRIKWKKFYLSLSGYHHHHPQYAL